MKVVKISSDSNLELIEYDDYIKNLSKNRKLVDTNISYVIKNRDTFTLKDVRCVVNMDTFTNFLDHKQLLSQSDIEIILYNIYDFDMDEEDLHTFKELLTIRSL